MGKSVQFFLASLKAYYWEQLWKVFFEDVDDETPTNVDKSCTKLRAQLIQIACCGIGPQWKTLSSMHYILFLWSRPANAYRCRPSKGLFNL